jgi:hypothetical protein
MIVSTLGLLAAAALHLARFGPYDNIVVDAHADGTVIAAYGDAHVVKLHVPSGQLGGCVTQIRVQKGTRCAFPHSGSLTFEPLGEQHYRFTFADALNVSIVDFIVDATGFAHALDAMDSAR